MNERYEHVKQEAHTNCAREQKNAHCHFRLLFRERLIAEFEQRRERKTHSTLRGVRKVQGRCKDSIKAEVEENKGRK
jgi:hypothetical protein